MKTQEELMEELIQWGAVHAFRYCILNKLDFSMVIEEKDDEVVAKELYEEMWHDEDNMSVIKTEFTSKFKTFNKI